MQRLIFDCIGNDVDKNDKKDAETDAGRKHMQPYY